MKTKKFDDENLLDLVKASEDNQKAVESLKDVGRFYSPNYTLENKYLNVEMHFNNREADLAGDIIKMALNKIKRPKAQLKVFFSNLKETVMESTSKLTYITAIQRLGLNNILLVDANFFTIKNLSRLKPHQYHRELNVFIDLRLSNKAMQRRLIMIADLIKVKIKVDYLLMQKMETALPVPIFAKQSPTPVELDLEL